MKFTKLFTYFGMVTIIATNLFIYSCQKENITDKKSDKQSEQTLKNSPIINRIIDFRNKVDAIRENPSFKSGGEPMEIDTVIWYLEAISNYTYSNAGFDFDQKLTDSSFVSVPITNGLVLLTDFQTTYDQIIGILSDYNESIPTIDKQFLVADVSLNETTANNVIFKVTYSFGTKDASTVTNEYSWYWGWALGRCDGSGQGSGQDAADIISLLANDEINIPSGTAFYVNVTMCEAYPFDYLDVNGNPLLFHDYQEITLNHKCISALDIEQYKDNVEYIGMQMKPQFKSVIDYDVQDWFAAGITPNGDDYWDMIHHVWITYAMWIVKSDDEIRVLPTN
jgi:hypothetical protein